MNVVNPSDLSYDRANMQQLGREIYVNIPIVNIQLSRIENKGPPLELKAAANQMDWFIENKALVPKNKTIVYSKDVMFIHVERRNTSLQYANLTGEVAFQQTIMMPGHFSMINGRPKINTQQILFEQQFKFIGNTGPSFFLYGLMWHNPPVDSKQGLGVTDSELEALMSPDSKYIDAPSSTYTLASCWRVSKEDQPPSLTDSWNAYDPSQIGKYRGGPDPSNPGRLNFIGPLTYDTPSTADADPSNGNVAKLGAILGCIWLYMDPNQSAYVKRQKAKAMADAYIGPTVASGPEEMEVREVPEPRAPSDPMGRAPPPAPKREPAGEPSRELPILG